MKVNKVRIVRPEVDIEIIKPFIGKLYFAFVVLPQLIKVKRCKIKATLNLNEYSGTVYTFRIWIVFVPKIKVVKRQ